MNSIKSLLFASLIFTGACSESISVSQNPLTVPTEYEMPQIDLYLSRGSFQQTSFEQFKFANKVLFAECGRIAGGRQFAQHQNVFRVSDEEAESLRLLAFKVISFKKEHSLKLDESGDSDSMFDPGQFILKLSSKSGKEEIKTSLDSVATPTKTSTELLNDLAQGLRRISMDKAQSSSLCGNRNFFDLGAKNPLDSAS